MTAFQGIGAGRQFGYSNSDTKPVTGLLPEDSANSNFQALVSGISGDNRQTGLADSLEQPGATLNCCG